MPSSQKTLSGLDKDCIGELGRGSSVLKEELASACCSTSEEQVDYESDDPSEEFWDDGWYDAQSDEWFESEQEEWFESWSAWTWHWQDDIYYACKRCPKYTKPVVPPKPKPKKKKVKVEPKAYAFPCVLMLVSFVMLTMHTVGSMYKGASAQWKAYCAHLFDEIKVPQSLYRWLKLFWWPPPEYKAQIKRNKTHRRKLLLTALAIAVMKADGAAPRITYSKHKALRRTVRKATGPDGLLLSAKLTTEGVNQVREALQNLPADLFNPGDSKVLIVDSGCSDTATGDKSDAVPGTVVPLEKPKTMDGVGGALQATHNFIFKYEVLSDDGTIQTIDVMGYYVLGLDCRLLSPYDYSLK